MNNSVDQKIIGTEEGDQCNRNGCTGIIDVELSDLSCSCHISPPCAKCTTPLEYCPQCEWYAQDEQNKTEAKAPKTKNYEYSKFKSRPLDNTKIDWRWDCRHRSNTNSSMVKSGVFPKGTPPSRVKAEVDGTFGGRFIKFDSEACTFTFVAYTD